MTHSSFKTLTRRSVLLGGGAVSIGACTEPVTRPYTGPAIDGIVVKKADRAMFLLNGDDVIKSYGIDLGFAPVGHKVREGDGKTPEGQYFIDRKNNRSAFYRSLGISYPNARDRAVAARLGVSPGGDIFIHGESRDPRQRGAPDWTAGCIAVSDREMTEVFAMVSIGTPIWILT